MHTRRAWTCGVLLIVSTGLAAQPAGPGQSAQLDETLQLVGRRVEDYYARARRVVATERVLIQPLRSDLLPDGRGRRLVYELRVEWEPPTPGAPAGDARIVRQLLSVNGGPLRPKADDEGCIDPASVSPEPLAMFLLTRQDQYSFSWAGMGRTDGRASVMLDFKTAHPEPPEIIWKGECVTIDVPAKFVGRAWIDAETGDVLRIDEWFTGRFDIRVPREHQQHGAPIVMTIERADTSIRYQRFTFSDPDETMLLPATIESVSIIQNAGSPRLRVTQTFSDYKRFTTASRVVK